MSSDILFAAGVVGFSVLAAAVICVRAKHPGFVAVCDGCGERDEAKAKWLAYGATVGGLTMAAWTRPASRAKAADSAAV